MLMADIKDILMPLDGVEDIEIEFVWSPPWTPDMMSDEAKDIMSYFHL
jgi:metal-sulfur cluster biosynthetic enzyme